jgi:hypothetical protein
MDTQRDLWTGPELAAILRGLLMIACRFPSTAFQAGFIAALEIVAEQTGLTLEIPPH